MKRNALGKFRELVDLEKISQPMTVRFVKKGDTLTPLGAPGKKKVLQFLAERHVPAEERLFVPVVADKRGIIWVVGHRIDDRVKITPATKRKALFRCTQPLKYTRNRT